MTSAAEPTDDLPYVVMVDDNFHYMDASYRETYGSFATREEALTACRGIVDASLRNSYKPGMTAEELYKHYVSFGEDPFIIGDSQAYGDKRFSAWNYAKERSRIMTAAT